MAEGPLFEDAVDAASWKTFSLLALQARKALMPTSANESLLAHQPASADSPLRALFRFWAADNLRREMRFEEAIELCGSFAANFPGAAIGHRAISPQVDRLVASCQRSLGLYSGAVGSLERLAADTPDPGEAAELLLRAGIWAESIPELRETALETYRRAASLERQAGDETGLAHRHLERLENAKQASFAADPQTLALRIARLLRSKDARGLFDLASPTHFSVGIGCHRFFAEPGEVLGELGRSLKGTRVRLDPHTLRVHGGKAYLRTEGWYDRTFRGGITFLLIRSPLGWQFGGVNFELRPDLPTFVPPKLPDLTPLPVGLLTPLKAPWPAGQCFMAGGFREFEAEYSALLSLLLPCIFFNPIACAAAVVNFAVILEAFSRRDCGFGFRGFYYDQGSTHRNRDQFAVDFTRYRHGRAFRNNSEGTPVLAVTSGMVTHIVDDLESGDSSQANQVHLRHILDFGTVETAFHSQYLHLAGPNLVPVSLFMYAPQGCRLGEMDDTGLSALCHLHFSLHDDNQNGDTVPPSPLDGRLLGPGDSGICICSTNVEVP